MSIVVIILSLVGLWISVYFTGVFYKWFERDVMWIPKVCQFEEKTCMTVLEAPQAKMFGFPNSFFGILIYSYLILDQAFFQPWLGLGVLSIAVARSIYLAYSLIYVIKIPCPLCFTSHIINTALFVIYLVSFV